MSEAINRTTGRILNSFEENRMQSRIFTDVQNPGTMDRYAAQRSDLLLFLLKLAKRNESYLVLSIRYIQRLPAMGDCMRRIETLGENLLAVSTKQLSLANCLREFTEGDEDVESDTSNHSTQSLALLAQDFMEEIDCLSFAMVRYNWESLTSRVQWSGSWRCTQSMQRVLESARHLSPSPLSGWIHCIQIQLLGYCLQEARKLQGSHANVEQLLREQARCSRKPRSPTHLRAQLVASALLDC